MLGIDLGYDITDKLYGEINFRCWFQKECDWGEDSSGCDIADLAGDAASAGITLSYRYAGQSYSQDDDDQTEEKYGPQCCIKKMAKYWETIASNVITLH